MGRSGTPTEDEKAIYLDPSSIGKVQPWRDGIGHDSSFVRIYTSTHRQTEADNQTQERPGKNHFEL